MAKELTGLLILKGQKPTPRQEQATEGEGVKGRWSPDVFLGMNLLMETPFWKRLSPTCF